MFYYHLNPCIQPKDKQCHLENQPYHRLK